MNSIAQSIFDTARRGVIGAAVLGLSTAIASAEPSGRLSKLIAMGNSLTDTGRVYAASGGMAPADPYWEGRFSNGPVWCEYFASMSGIAFPPECQLAWGGSHTDDTNHESIPPFFLLPGFEQQVDEAIATDGDGKADPRALYSIWIGANDLIFYWAFSGNPNPVPVIDAAVANTGDGIEKLVDAGAHYFVVCNMPDLGITPLGLSMGPAVSGAFTYASALYNTTLDAELDRIEDEHRHVRIVRVDTFALINDMVANPADYGLINVTIPASPTLVPGVDADTSLFWDLIHPTTVAHAAVGERVLEEVLAAFPDLAASTRVPVGQ